MPDIPYGSDKVVGDIMSQIPTSLLGTTEHINFVLSEFTNKATDIINEGFGQKIVDGLKKKVEEARSATQLIMGNLKSIVETSSKYDDMRLRLFNNSKQIELKMHTDSVRKEQELIQKDLAYKLSLLKSEGLSHKYELEKIRQLKKDHDETMMALNKKAAKDEMKLKLEAQAASSNILTSMEGTTKLAGLGMLNGLEASLSGIPIWVGQQALDQSLKTSMASATLSAARSRATGVIGGGGGANIAGDINPALMTNIERMQLSAKIYSEAPRLINETANSFRNLSGYLGNFGIGINESADLLIKAQNGLAYSSDDLVNVYGKSAEASSKLGLSVSQTAGTAMAMVESLRLIGVGSREAIAIMKAMPDSTAMGKVTPQQLQEYSKAYANFLGNMEPSKIAGISMFLKGGGMPMGDDLTMAAKNMPQMMSQLYNQIKGQVGNNIDPRIFAQGFMSSMGIGIPGNMSSTEVFDKMNSGMPDVMEKTFKELQDNFKPTEEMIQKGMQSLVEIQGVMESIDKVLKELFVPIATLMGPVMKGLTSAGNVGGAGTIGTHVLGSALTGGAAGMMFGPWGGAIGAGGAGVADLLYELLFAQGATPVGR